MDHTTLIEKLGGPHAVHAELAQRGFTLTQVAVRAWALTDRIIPAKYWTTIKDIADQKGVEVTLEELAQGVPPAEPTAAPSIAA